jgi:hypothetical protein
MNATLSAIVCIVGLVSLAAAIYVWLKPQRPRGDGDVPIVITGGSVSLEFDHAHFRPENNNSSSHKRQGKITSLVIVDNNGNGKTYVGNIPPVPWSIDLICQDLTGQFPIALKGVGTDVTLEFDHGKLPVPNTSSNKNKHFSASATLKSMQASASFSWHDYDVPNTPNSDWSGVLSAGSTIYILTNN